MPKKYNPPQIEPRWQKAWEDENLYQAVDFSDKEKKYILVEFPYPSGERLHVGHGRTYCCLDVIARKYRMEGYNVMLPFGWDAFGLPTENYAIRTGISPRKATAENIANAKKQVKGWGLSIDWSREVNTTEPGYYKWTQWIFLKLLEEGLAYQDEVAVNWCPECKTNLANEEVLSDSTHERCGADVERRMQKQWLLKITKYADRLLEDLDTVNYLPKIEAQQKNWIGRSGGAMVKFFLPNSDKYIEVFTTRPDTIFGATFLILAPEHPLLENPEFQIPKSKKEKFEKYIEEAKQRSELERISEVKDKTGVFTGLYALHPLTEEEIPIYISDFVLISYGTGAIMGVPAHDKRDYEFAKKFGIPIKKVIESEFSKEGEVNTDYGTLVESGKYTGLRSKKAIEEVVEDLSKQGKAEKDTQYHLRDWVFSRQHYWGEPIPVVHCAKCGVVPVPEDKLPVKLPEIEKYKPTGTGESPLAAVEEWVNTSCPNCGGAAKRETDTMPNWAGSNWYYMRYCDPNNNQELADKEKLAYWMPVDWYNGGMEHTTLHLLYSRFIYKFLYDLGYVPGPEPYAKRTSHGVVLGPDSNKMSKSKGNVINPDSVLDAFGADTFRLYEAFMGPFDQSIAWDPNGVEGCHRFLNKVWRLVTKSAEAYPDSSEPDLERKLHQLINKVAEDLETMKFNTAVAALMEFSNSWAAAQPNSLEKKDAEKFLLILAPFAPYISEELWCSVLGNRFSIHEQSWPRFDPNIAKEDKITIIVQVNGKTRAAFDVTRVTSEKEIKKKARELPNVSKYLQGEQVKNTIYVEEKLVNFVV